MHARLSSLLIKLSLPPRVTELPTSLYEDVLAELVAIDPRELSSLRLEDTPDLDMLEFEDFNVEQCAKYLAQCYSTTGLERRTRALSSAKMTLDLEIKIKQFHDLM